MPHPRNLSVMDSPRSATNQCVGSFATGCTTVATDAQRHVEACKNARTSKQASNHTSWPTQPLRFEWTRRFTHGTQTRVVQRKLNRVVSRSLDLLRKNYRTTPMDTRNKQRVKDASFLHMQFDTPRKCETATVTPAEKTRAESARWRGLPRRRQADMRPQRKSTEIATGCSRKWPTIDNSSDNRNSGVKETFITTPWGVVRSTQLLDKQRAISYLSRRR